MEKRMKKKLVLSGSILSYLLMSVSILLMPISRGNIPVIPRAVMGILFWGFLVVGIALQIVLSNMCKKRTKRMQGKKIGILAFFATPYGNIADIVFAISVFGFVLTLILTDGTKYISYIFLAISVFSFCMHCVLNGKNVRSFHKENEIQIDKI